MNHYIFCKTCDAFFGLYQIHDYRSAPLPDNTGYDIFEFSSPIRSGKISIRDIANLKYIICTECETRLSEVTPRLNVGFQIKSKYTNILVSEGNCFLAPERALRLYKWIKEMNIPDGNYQLSA